MKSAQVRLTPAQQRGLALLEDAKSSNDSREPGDDTTIWKHVTVSNKTRDDFGMPWYLTIESKVARHLELLGLAETFVETIAAGVMYRTRCEITPAGRVLVGAPKLEAVPS